MGTRGAIGFRINGKDKVTYNHFDSYPTGIGVQVVEFLKNTGDAELMAMAKKIKMVKEDGKPTPKQIDTCIKAGMVDLSVSERSTADWYCLLRNAQGDLAAYGKLGYMTDSKKFLLDSLFCEFAYIINLDTMELEFYKGFNRTAGAGRYGSKRDKEDGKLSDYYGVALFRSVPFLEIREMDETPEKYCENISNEMRPKEEVDA
jgi:hypothetical protein